VTWGAIRRERDEQADGLKLLGAIGACVYVSGTVRPKGDTPGTRQTPGIPDVEVFLPARDGRRRLLKWEVKRSTGGRLSPAQREYQALCAAADVAHVVGPCDALLAWLEAHGYVRADQLTAERQARIRAWSVSA
jgi:hypothetical protein